MNRRRLWSGLVIAALAVSLVALPRGASHLWPAALTAPVARAQVGTASPDLAGMWNCHRVTTTCHTEGGSTAITQSGVQGEFLRFTAENGDTSAGSAQGTTVSATDWNLTGMLSGLVGNCYTQINWSNGVQWTRTAPTGGCGSYGLRVWTVNASTGTINQGTYHNNDTLQVCYALPSLGGSVFTDTTPDGTSSIIYQFGGSPQSGCVPGTFTVVVPPSGTECVRLDFTSTSGISAGSNSAQVCWTDMS